MPFALGLPPHLYRKLQQTADRLRIRRGDTLCELLEQYADNLKITDLPRRSGRAMTVDGVVRSDL